MDEHSIFMAALECEDEQSQREFIREACGENGPLRERVARLLRVHESASDFLEKPVLSAPEETLSEGPGTLIGSYKLLEQIGEGGMGVVYMAAQQQPVKRKVAIKIIKPGMDTRQVIARFEAERQALALMEHENIARVLDAGATDSGRPYFVMELVRGIPVTEYCRRERLAPEPRMRLFVDVCHAVQHAHHKGIIHRDIKPSNVMVTLHDGEPVVKMIDFGVAKATNQQLTDRTLFTNYAQMIGTPLYMSPEQAEMSGLDVDTRSDIYSLGVLLYELLTDTTPFEKDRLKEVGYDEMRRIICEEDPPKPSTRLSTIGAARETISDRRRADARRMSQALRGELDWIVVKSLEKNRSRRYQTAKDFAEDVLRYLNGEPVEACPPSVAYLARKFLGRHRGLVASTCAIGLMLITGTVIATSLAIRAGRLEQQAEEAQAKAENEAAIATAISDFLSDELLGQANPYENPNRELRLREVLDRASVRIDGNFEGQPLVEAKIRVTLGSTYFHLGEYQESARHFDRAYQIYLTELGPNDPKTLKVAAQRAFFLSATEGDQSSLNALEETWAMQRKVLPPDAPDTLLTMAWCAWRYTTLARFDDAEALFSRTIPAMEQVFGPEHRETLDCLDSLARLFSYQERYEESVALHERVLRARQRRLGEDHPQFQDSLSALADLKMMAGDTEEALEMYCQVGELRRRVQGEYHPSTLASDRDEVDALQRAHLLDAAEKRCLATLAAHRQRYGEDDRRTRYTMMLLAAVLETQGRFDVSLPYRTAVLESRRRMFGNDHRATINASRTLAYIYLQLKQFHRADELHQEALDTLTRLYGDDDPRTMNALHRLAYGYQLARRSEDAERILKELITRKERILGPDDPQTIESVMQLAFVCKRRRRWAEAEAYFRQAWDDASRVLGRDDYKTLDTGINLAASIRQQNRPEEAEAIFRQVLNQCRAAFGDNHVLTANCLVELAVTCRRLDRLDEAADLLAEAIDIRRIVQGDSHRQLFEAIDKLADLAECYRRRDEPEKETTLRAALREQVVNILDAQRARYGDQHVSTLATMRQAAQFLARQRDFELARRLFEEIAATCRQTYGADDQRSIDAAQQLAHQFRRQRDFDRAKEMQEEVVARQVACSGDDDPKSLKQLLRLAEIERYRGDFDSAESLLRTLWEKYPEITGPDHADRLFAGLRLATVCRLQNRLDEAERLLREILERQERIYGEEHLTTVESLSDLATLLTQAKRWQEAETTLDRIIRIRRRAQGDRHPDTLGAVTRLARLVGHYQQQDDAESAMALRIRIHQLSTELLGETSVEALQRLANITVAQMRAGRWQEMYETAARLVELRSDPAVQDEPPYHAMLWKTEALLQLGRHAEAEAFIRECVALWEAAGPDRKGHFQSRPAGTIALGAELARSLTASGKYEEAEATLLELYALPAFADLPRQKQRRVVGELVGLYQAWDDPEKAKHWTQAYEALDETPAQ